MKLKPIPVPYPMAPVLGQPKRHRYMLSCLQHGFPKLTQRPMTTESLSIVGYGPSLKDTWQDIKRPILTMSGAHNFLIERGIVPDFHADMDPRPHKISFVQPPHKDVHYVMASVCNPNIWPVLKDYKVTTWHVISGDDTIRFLGKFDPGSLLVAGFSNMGLVSIHLGGVLGFNHFEIHGFDGSWSRGERHAGPHGGFKHGEVSEIIYGRRFLSSRIMMNSNVELQYLLTHFPVFCVFHGDGYNPWWVKHQDLPSIAVAGTEKAEAVRKGVFVEAA